MKIISWNVNGVRAIVKKGFLDQLKQLDADIVCLQETKAQEDQVHEALFGCGYEIIAYSAEITAEFEKFYVVTAYVPNSKAGLARLDYRKTWDRALLEHCSALQNRKPVILNGDMNVCHQAIDIARPDANYNKSPGYTQTEIDGMSNFINSGLKDSFRELYPDEVKYSWWSFRAGARERNIGWRLDYMLVSEALMPKVKDSFILNEFHGSDHCPVGVELSK